MSGWLSWNKNGAKELVRASINENREHLKALPCSPFALYPSQSLSGREKWRPDYFFGLSCFFIYLWLRELWYLLRCFYTIKKEGIWLCALEHLCTINILLRSSSSTWILFTYNLLGERESLKSISHVCFNHLAADSADLKPILNIWLLGLFTCARRFHNELGYENVQDLEDEHLIKWTVFANWKNKWKLYGQASFGSI